MQFGHLFHVSVSLVGVVLTTCLNHIPTPVLTPFINQSPFPTMMSAELLSQSQRETDSLEILVA